MRLLVLLSAVAAAAAAIDRAAVRQQAIQEWETYKATYGKVYSCEDKERLDLFIASHLQVAEQNEKFARGESSWTAGINKFADMTPEEMSRMNGLKPLKRVLLPNGMLIMVPLDEDIDQLLKKLGFDKEMIADEKLVAMSTEGPIRNALGYIPIERMPYPSEDGGSDFIVKPAKTGVKPVSRAQFKSAAVPLMDKSFIASAAKQKLPRVFPSFEAYYKAKDIVKVNPVSPSPIPKLPRRFNSIEEYLASKDNKDVVAKTITHKFSSFASYARHLDQLKKEKSVVPTRVDQFGREVRPAIQLTKTPLSDFPSFARQFEQLKEQKSVVPTRVDQFGREVRPAIQPTKKPLAPFPYYKRAGRNQELNRKGLFEERRRSFHPRQPRQPRFHMANPRLQRF